MLILFFSLCEIASYCKAIYTDSPPHSKHRKFCKLHETVGLILNINVNNYLRLNYFTVKFRMYFVQEKYEECKDSFCLFPVLLIQAQNELCSWLLKKFPISGVSQKFSPSSIHCMNYGCFVACYPLAIDPCCDS